LALWIIHIRQFILADFHLPRGEFQANFPHEPHSLSHL
jgi:hypothetical protein